MFNDCKDAEKYNSNEEEEAENEKDVEKQEEDENENVEKNSDSDGIDETEGAGDMQETTENNDDTQAHGKKTREILSSVRNFIINRQISNV